MRRFTPAEQFPTFIRMGRVLPRVGKWVGLLLAAALGAAWIILASAMVLANVAFTILPYILAPKVRAEIAAFKARGEPVTPADLAGPKIPDSQNGAVVYERIFREMDRPQVKKDMEVLKGFSSDKERAQNPSLWKDARSAAKRTAYLLPMIEEAQSKPKCRFAVNWYAPAPEVTFPHLAKLRRLSLLLRSTALLDAANGDQTAMLRAMALGLGVAESLKDEPASVSQMCRVSCMDVACRTLRSCCQVRRISEADARWLFGILSRIDLSDSLAIGFQGERAMMVPFFELVRDRHRATMRQVEKWPAGIGAVESQPRERVNGFWRSYTLADELFYLRTMGQYIACARLPYRELERKGLNPVPKDFPKYALFTLISLPLFNSARQDRAKSEIAGSQILLALMAYKDRYGSYPASLDELRAKLGWKLPEDPFSGRDFIYKRQGKGFILYSIGPNLKDDGGIEPPKNDRDQGDIVWRMER